MFRVLKPFPHPTRRFAAGDTVTEADISECVIELADLLKGMFIVGAEVMDSGGAVSAKDLRLSPSVVPEPAESIVPLKKNSVGGLGDVQSKSPSIEPNLS